MATKRVKNVKQEPTEIKPVEQAVAQPEKTDFDFSYRLTVDADVTKAVEEIQKLVPVEEPVKNTEELFTVKSTSIEKIFASNESGRYIVLSRAGKYANLKTGDVFRK